MYLSDRAALKLCNPLICGLLHADSVFWGGFYRGSPQLLSTSDHRRPLAAIVIPIFGLDRTDRRSANIPYLKIYASANLGSTPLNGATTVDLCGKEANGNEQLANSKILVADAQMQTAQALAGSHIAIKKGT